MLITLTIIGVIAALTIPNLMQKYQDEALKTAFKKTYNVLNNAYKMVIAENGIPECYYGNTVTARAECQTFYNKFFSILKVVKHCENNALQNGCLPDGGYKNAVTVERGNGMSEEDANNSHSGCGFTRDNNMNTYYSAVVLNDGQIVIYSKEWCIMFVDINGKKGPNKWGYDIFEFDIEYGRNRLNSKFHPVITVPGYNNSCVLVEKGGKTPIEMYRSVILNK